MCVQTCYSDGYERAELTVAEKITPRTNSRARTEGDVGQTNTNLQTGGVSCFIFGIDICTRGGYRVEVSCAHSKQLEQHNREGV